MHDLVIANARLIDGLGTPARAGSLAVTDGRIAAVSDDRRGADLGSARARVDAQGLVLAPGIVDPTTVGRGGKRRVIDLPTGASRLDTPAVGLHGVWVNGVRTVDERGVVAECGRPGRLLRDFAP